MCCGIPLLGLIGAILGGVAWPGTQWRDLGRGLALAAVVCGLLATSSPLLLAGVMWVREQGEDRRMIRDAKRDALAAHAWAAAYAQREGHYPPTLDSEVFAGLEDHGVGYHGKGLPPVPPEEGRAGDVILLEVNLAREGRARSLFVFLNGRTTLIIGHKARQRLLEKDRQARRELGFPAAFQDHWV